jgi:hypothetical protein
MSTKPLTTRTALAVWSAQNVEVLLLNLFGGSDTIENHLLCSILKSRGSFLGCEYENLILKNSSEVKKVKKRTFYLLGLLVIFCFGSSIALGADLGLCPIHSTDNEAILDLPQEEILTSGESYSIPRNQVLLEVFGRVT